MSQGAQAPHTQLGGNVGGGKLIWMALEAQSMPGALGVLAPFLLMATPRRGVTMSIYRGGDSSGSQ